MPATVFFDGVLDPRYDNDPFCVGNTCYVRISFELPAFTLTGLSLTAEDVFTSPAAKAATSVTSVTRAGEFLIWNSLGSARHTRVPGDAQVGADGGDDGDSGADGRSDTPGGSSAFEGSMGSVDGGASSTS